jgi:hypothetical protein
MDYQLKLVPLRLPFLQEYLAWQETREKPWPHMAPPSCGLWVVATGQSEGYPRLWQKFRRHGSQGGDFWGWGEADLITDEDTGDVAQEPGGFLLEDDGPLHVPVAGLAMFVGANNWLMCDHFATNPDVSPRVRREAAILIAKTIPIVGAFLGSTPTICPNAQSLTRILEKHGGFKLSRHANGKPVQAMYVEPVKSAWVRSKKAPRQGIPGGPQEVPAMGTAGTLGQTVAPKRSSRKAAKKPVSAE